MKVLSESTKRKTEAVKYVAFKASHKEVEIYPQLNVNPPMTYIFPQLKASHKKGWNLPTIKCKSSHDLYFPKKKIEYTHNKILPI